MSQFSINLKNNHTITKKNDFDNQIAAIALNKIDNNIDKNVYYINTQPFKEGKSLSGETIAAMLQDRIGQINVKDKHTLDDAKELLGIIKTKQQKSQQKKCDELCEKITPYVITLIKADVEATVNSVFDELTATNNIVKFTSGGAKGAGGHAFVLYRDSNGEYHIISSTKTDEVLESMREEYWFQCLEKKITPKKINVITKNRQNYTQGCIFCASYTEKLLRAGCKIADLPDQMPKDIERQMMEFAYLSMRPIYNDDDLTDLDNEAYIQQGWHDHPITIEQLKANIDQNAHNSDNIIKNLQQSLKKTPPSAISSVRNKKNTNKNNNYYTEKTVKDNHQDTIFVFGANNSNSRIKHKGGSGQANASKNQNNTLHIVAKNDYASDVSHAAVDRLVNPDFSKIQGIVQTLMEDQRFNTLTRSKIKNIFVNANKYQGYTLSPQCTEHSSIENAFSVAFQKACKAQDIYFTNRYQEGYVNNNGMRTKSMVQYLQEKCNTTLDNLFSNI